MLYDEFINDSKGNPNFIIHRSMPNKWGWKKVRRFRTADACHKFLNTGSNACDWSICRMDELKDAKTGTYVYAGQVWRNTKNIDPSALAHF